MRLCAQTVKRHRGHEVVVRYLRVELMDAGLGP